MRHRFEDSSNMNLVNQKFSQKINSIRTWSSQKEEILCEIMSFVPLKFEYGNYYFQFRNFYIPFMNLQSIGFKLFAKIMKGNCVFYSPSCISFNPKTHL